MVSILKGVLKKMIKFESDEYNYHNIYLKQTHLRQMMNLKAKGRYLEETKLFTQEICTNPSPESQKKVVS